MAGIFTGVGAGLARGSGSVLGGSGLLGSASAGRAGENLLVNAATGNLVITRQDEFLTGRGQDFGVSRTYNSLAEIHDGDNGDKWQLSTIRRVFGLTGTLGAAGSTIRRHGSDGSVVTYGWGVRGGVSAYWTPEGDGAHDKLAMNGGGQWVWTDGSSQVSEVYEANPADAGAYRILRQVDTMGQTLEFTYHAGTQLDRVTTGNGEFIQYSWSGSQVTQINTGINDQATGTFRTVTRTYYTYDGSGRLASVKVDLSPDTPGIADGHVYTTGFEYGANGLVSAVAQTDGSRTEIVYDAAGRVSQLTERASSTETRVTSFAYGVSYTDVTAPNGQVTRLEYQGADVNTATLWDWAYDGVDRAAADPIDGNVAVKYTSSIGATWSGTSWGLNAAAGQTFKFTVSLKAVAGSSTVQDLGLWGNTSGYVTPYSSARIVSGPGTIEQWTGQGAFWRVTGLSTTEATRIEIIRTYAQAESGGAFLYVDYPGAYRDGQQLIVGGSSLEALNETSVFAGLASGWPIGGLGTQSGGTVGGAPAVLLTSSTGATWSATYAYLTARRGDTFKFTVNLQAVAGSSTEQSLGLHGDNTAWFNDNFSHARIVSGPGTLVRHFGGFWKITGLSTTQATRIEIVRTYDRDESGAAYVYVDHPAGYGDGQQLLISAPVVTKFTDYPANEKQLSRIIAPPAYSGAARQEQTFEYDADGNLVKSTAPSGAVSNYQYDAMGNVTLIDNPVGADVARAYDAGNRVVLETSHGSDENYDAVTYYTSYAYAATGLLRFRVSPDGKVIEYTYDSYGRMVSSIEYTGHRYTGGSSITEASMLSWRNGLADKTRRHVSTYTYDARGNLALSYSYGAASADGNASTIDGYTLTYYAYDHLGRLLSTYRHNDGQETYQYDGLGRVVASNNPASGVTAVFFDDANTRTVMHLASGLNRTLTYNKSGDLIGEVESAVGTETANLQPDLLSWVHSRIGRTAAAAIAGAPAYQYTSPANGDYGYVYTGFNVSAGETVRYRITLKGNGVTTMHRLGLYGATEGWGAPSFTDTAAVIVSGPGRLSRTEGADLAGLWQIDGVSSTTETVIEVVRTFTVAQAAYSYFYVGGTGPVTAGTGVILSAPSFTRTLPDSTLAISTTTTNGYDKLGRLRVSYDQFDSGNRTYFVYDNAGRKTAEINDYGHMTEYLYDTGNRLIGSVKYATAVAAGHLTTLQNPNNTLTAAQLRPAANAYDLREWTIYDAGGRVVQSIDGIGTVTAYEYDGANRVVRTTVYTGRINAAGVTALIASPPTAPVSVAALTDPARDAVTRTFYDRDGNVRGTLDGEGYVAAYTYDAAGRKIEEIRYPQAVLASQRATANFTTLVGYAVPASPDVRITRLVYDARGLLRFQLDQIGAQNQATEFIYGAWSGHLTGTRAYYTPISVANYDLVTVKAAVATHANDRVTTNTLDKAGRPTSTTDAGGTITYYTYDASGNVTKVRRGSNALTEQVTRNWYDARGNLRFSVDPAGFLTQYSYTAGGRLESERLYDTAVSVTDTTTIAQVAALATGAYTEKGYWYDTVGRLAREFDGTGAFKLYEYYATGLLRTTYTGYTTLSPLTDRSTTLLSYNAAGQLIQESTAYAETEQVNRTFAYDKLGNLERATDGRNISTTSTYDRRGLLQQVTDGAGGITAYEYNAFGEVTKVTDPRLKASYSYYDTLGRVTRTRDAENYVTETTYTAFGEVVAVTRRYNKTASAVTVPPVVTVDANDATTRFYYDKLGRVTRTTDALEANEYFAYNEVGDRISATGKLGGVTTYAYDRRGLKVSETLPMSSVNTAGTVLASTVTNTFEYDARGNLIKETKAVGLPEVNVTEYKYDAADRLTEIVGQMFHTYVPHTYYAYDARGNLTRTTDPKGARTVYFHDDLGRITAEINAAGTYTAYTYDPNGNVLDIKVYAAPVTIPADGGSQEEAPAPSGDYRHTTFTYDNLDRMLTSSVLGASSGSWNGSTWTAATAALTTQYQYDANGNVVKTVDPNGNATWAYYDPMNRKTVQIDALGYRTSWIYDGEGNVTLEVRYAIAGAIPSSTSTPPPAPAADINLDRITGYIYDPMGNRKLEVIHYVLTHDGSGGHYVSHVQIAYTYNGLGQVTRKTEQTGEAVSYDYDQAGRLIQETKTAFTDYTGASVTPFTQYAYDGLGNLTRTRQAGNATAADRITRYSYDGGKLRSVFDAEVTDGNGIDGKITNYWYDLAGNVVYEYYTRYNSDGTKAGGSDYDGVYRVYDGLGRATQQWNVTYPTGAAWAQDGPKTTTHYNAFGEVASVQVGSSALQENRYDKAGRLIASNAGDGVWKLFAHDRNGNQTLTIVSAGYNLAGLDAYANIHDLWNRADTAHTLSGYDARNQAITVWEANRDLSASSRQTLTTARTYNGFGGVASETNAAGGVTTYTYNTMGRKVRSEGPAVSITDAAGASYWVKPSQDYYYDLGGRLVAARDANGTYAATGSNAPSATTKAAGTGNLTRYAVLAGTGYGGGQALITSETHADGGVRQTRYDIHGDARVLVDEMGRLINQAFDQLGRVTEIYRPGSGLTDYYQYDGLGQQLKHYNSLLGSANAEVTNYDGQGRVISRRAFGGNVTTYIHGWYDSISTFGGWQEVETQANGRQSVEQTDIFGKVRYRVDFGGHVYTHYYDVAGRLYQLTNSTSGSSQLYAYYNSGQVKSVEVPYGGGTSPKTTYGYDAMGNVASQVTYDAAYGTTQGISATYDTMGRLTYWSEAGNAATPAASASYRYDANGNVRQVAANHNQLDGFGTPYSAAQTTWYGYDSMNRVVSSSVNGQWTSVAYHADGQRAQSWASRSITEGYYVTNPHTYGQEYHTITYDSPVVEEYTYDGAGRLYQVHGQQGWLDYESWYLHNAFGGADPMSSYVVMGGSQLAAQFTYDAMGRVTLQQDSPGPSGAAYSRAVTYDSAGRVATEDASTLRRLGSAGNELYRAYTVNTYGTGYNDSPDAAASFTTQTWKNGSDGASPDTSTVNSYVWWDSAQQGAITHYPGTGTNTSSYSYNGFGQVVGVGITDGRSRTVTFRNSADGQVIRRDEADGNGSLGDPHEVHYRLAGKHLGTVGNNGTANGSYSASIGQRTTAPGSGPFRGGLATGTAYADFGLGYDAINSFSQGSEAGLYTVRAGDTLQGIAQALWGDSALWYKLAEANGLGGGGGLAEGRSLVIPVGVVRIHNNAGTSRPYNPAEALGDTSPTRSASKGNGLWTPPSRGGCGAFGQILLAVVAVAVTLAAPIGGSTLGAAIANSVLGNVASQGVGLATGIQNKFDFKGVALSAVSAGVSGGIASQFGGAFAGSQIAGDIMRGAASSAITQGIGVVTNLQDKFSWAGVAAAGIGAGVGGGAARYLGQGAGFFSTQFGNDLASTSAAVLASAATRSAIEGSSFGDNLALALPDAIGSTLGRALGGAMNHVLAKERAARGRIEGNPADGSSRAPGLDPDWTEMVNQEAIHAAVGQVAAYDAATLLYQDAASASLLGAGSAVVSMLTRREALVRQALAVSLAEVPAGSGNGLVSESIGGSYSALVGQAVTYFEMSLKEAYFAEVAARVGPNPSRAELLDLAEMPMRLGAERVRLNEAYAAADREVWNVVSTGLGADGLTGGYRIAVNGEYTWENGLAVGSSLLGGILSVGGKIGGKISSSTIRSGAAKGEVGDGLVYLRTDTTGKLAPYVGQTTEVNELARQAAHARTYPNSRFEFDTLESGIPRGSQLDIAEHNAIQARTDGVAARRSSVVSNQRDPVGPLRRPAFGLPEPR